MVKVITKGVLLCSLVTPLCSFAHPVHINPLIVNGSDAKSNEAPWQVYIETKKNNKYYSCGGTVIADRWILTASHCLDSAPDSEPAIPVSASDATVYFGSHALNSPDLDAIYAKRVILHPQYNKSSMHNDIALIELSWPISSRAQAIKLMTENEQVDADIEFNQGVQSNLYLSGWGSTVINPTDEAPGMPLRLQKVLLNGEADNPCSRTWGAGNTEFSDQFICAGAKSTGSCSGDSGGPLVWQDKSHAADSDKGYRLAGVVSYGHASQCANDEFPDVYIQVSNARNWILSHIENYQEPDSSFPIEIFDESLQVIEETAPKSGGGSIGLAGLLALAGLARFRKHNK